MASMKSKSGKCSNFGNCATADARATVEVPGGLDFVCNECGKPLLLSDTGLQSGGSKTLLVGGLLLAMLLVGGGAAWFLLADTAAPMPPPAMPAPATPAVVAPAPPAPPAPPTPQTEAPTRPAHGHCSPADERAGLCRTTP